MPIKRLLDIRFICIVALMLRLFHLGKDSLWLDEVYSLNWASNSSVKEMVRLLIRSDNHPPFLYIFLHYWIKIFGSSEFMLRLPSAIAGTTVVYLVYGISNLIFERKISIISALLTAVSPFFIWHSQEARMYAFLPMFSLSSLYFLIRALGDNVTGLRVRESASRRVCGSSWIGYIIFSLCALYTHYFAIFTLFAEFVFVLLLRREILRRYLPSLATIVLLYIPCIMLFLDQFYTSARLHAGIFKSTIWAVPHAFFEFSTGYSLLVTELAKFTLKDLYIIIPAGLTFGYIFLQGLSKLKHTSLATLNEFHILLFIYLFIPIILSYLVSLRIPIFGSKYLSAPAALYYIFLGRGLSLQFVKSK